MSKVILTLQGDFNLARLKVKNNPKRFSGLLKKFRKIRAPIKIKSALPPPPNPPPQKKEEFYGHGFSCRKNAFFPGVHKIGAPISGPRIADTNFTDTRIFLNRHPTPILPENLFGLFLTFRVISILQGHF